MTVPILVYVCEAKLPVFVLNPKVHNVAQRASTPILLFNPKPNCFVLLYWIKTPNILTCVSSLSLKAWLTGLSSQQIKDFSSHISASLRSA